MLHFISRLLHLNCPIDKRHSSPSAYMSRLKLVSTWPLTGANQKLIPSAHTRRLQQAT